MPFLTIHCNLADAEQVKAFGADFGATLVGEKKGGIVFALERPLTFIREAHSAGLTLIEVATEKPEK